MAKNGRKGASDSGAGMVLALREMVRFIGESHGVRRDGAEEMRLACELALSLAGVASRNPRKARKAGKKLKKTLEDIQCAPDGYRSRERPHYPNCPAYNNKLGDCICQRLALE